MLTVSDTGIGMDAATRSRIFEPFFTTKEKGKGTGLGLSIVYGIVKQNGGEILVYSEPGQGTVFRLYLPVALEAHEPAPAPAVEVREEPATETILLVEDEEQVRSLARAILARQGYQVIDFSSPAEALAFTREHPEQIHLLLTDVVMPEMSGPELARQLRGARPEVKVLFMSGYTEYNAADQGAVAAGTPYIQKPFTADALREKVRAALS